MWLLRPGNTPPKSQSPGNKFSNHQSPRNKIANHQSPRNKVPYRTIFAGIVSDGDNRLRIVLRRIQSFTIYPPNSIVVRKFACYAQQFAKSSWGCGGRCKPPAKILDILMLWECIWAIWGHVDYFPGGMQIWSRFEEFGGFRSVDRWNRCGHRASPRNNQSKKRVARI